LPFKFSEEDEAFLKKTWKEWREGEKFGKYKLSMTYLDLRHLYRFFLETLRTSGIGATSSIPPYWGEIWDVAIDRTLTKQENMARIEREVLKYRPTSPMDIVAQAEEGKIDAEMLRYLETMADELGKSIVDREMAEKVSMLEGTIQQLTEEKKRRRLAERELEKAVKLVRELKDRVVKLEEELKKRPPAKVYKFTVIRMFKEGVANYIPGQVLKFTDPKDVEWAKRKVAEGFLEEYTEKPVKPPVQIRPPVKTLTEVWREAVEELTRL